MQAITVVHEDGQWWVRDPNGTVLMVGGYETKKEATEAASGLRRFWQQVELEGNHNG